MENTFWTALATSTVAALVIPRHLHDTPVRRLGASQHDLFHVEYTLAGGASSTASVTPERRSVLYPQAQAQDGAF